MRHLRINAFELVYLAIAAATFQHTVWSAAMTFDGPPPQAQWEYVHWAFNGALLAVAIDIGMLVTARELAKHRNLVLIVGFIIAAIASFYTQTLYSLYHASPFTWGTGVTQEWVNRLQPLVDARIILMPLMLPLFAVIYTVAKIQSQKSEARDIKVEVQTLSFEMNGVTYGPYATLEEMRQAKKRLITKQRRVERRAQEKQAGGPSPSRRRKTTNGRSHSVPMDEMIPVSTVDLNRH